MLRLSFSQRALRFNFPARTSRGSLAEHVAWYLHLADDAAPAVVGVGEAAPLAGLSLDYVPTFPAAIAQLCERFNAGVFATFSAADAPAFVGLGWPSLVFALETAALDLARGGRRQLYANAFSEGTAPCQSTALCGWATRPSCVSRYGKSWPPATPASS
ncbi:hypothetical protein ACFQT0_13765 [Hymenobacter humi]|uniref:Uncharacterized protein n=1 Tax=Hymenobacter humi TaxID=1411620 RepID=A0ABW2U663_9BACT